MGKLVQAKFSVIFFVILSLIIGFNWFTGEKAKSFSEPNEALLDLDKDLLLIPVYKENNVSLYFFMKDNDKLGATFLEHGIFGWKTSGNLRYFPIKEHKVYEKLDRYIVHDEYFVYGLINSNVEPLIKLNGTDAKIINLASLDSAEIKEYNLENMYIWYYESEMPIANGKIEMFNTQTGDQIDTTVLDMKKDMKKEMEKE
jgi:hypothetical protein